MGDTLADALLAAAWRLLPPSLALTWMATYLPDAERRLLSPDDLARMDAYRGGAGDLHDLLPAVTPFDRARWWETALVAQHGTPMTLGYLAVPAPQGIAVGWAACGPGTLLGPVGPSIVTATQMSRPNDCPDAHWRELRAAVGIVLRALLLDLGVPHAD